MKQRLRVALKENSALLRHGLWLLTGPTIARHVSMWGLPDGLASTKTHKGSGFNTLSRWFRQVLHAVVPPFLVRIRERTIPRVTPVLRNDYALLVMSKAGEPILFDQACTEVIKLGVSPQADSGRKEIRRALARYFVVPEATVLDDGKIIRENFVDGEAFLCVGLESRATVIDQLVQGYEALTVNGARQAPDGFWVDAIAAVRAMDLPPTMRPCVERLGARFLASAQPIPFAPAHGDLSGNNLIVNTHGSALIDMDDCDYLPAFFDLFFLAHQECLRGRDDVWRCLVAGADRNPIDRALERLVTEGTLLDRHTWIWASFVAECYIWPRKAGAALLTRELLSAWWPPVQTALDYSKPGASPRGSVAPDATGASADTTSTYNG